MKNWFTIFCMLVLGVSTTNIQAQGTRKEYVKKYKNIAIEEMKKTGIPASIKLAQGILESGCGSSTLATKANNHFGIKCHDWTGKTYAIDDDKRNECFRKYNNPEQSWIDHSQFLTQRNRYSRLFDLEPTDYKGWAKGLKSSGYATNPKYDEILIRIIEEEKLYKYDELAINNTTRKAILLSDQPQTQQQTARPARVNYTARERLINNVPCIIAEDGDSYEKIASYYTISTSRLLSMNEKTNNAIAPGDIVYVAPKRNKAAKGYEFHRVVSGDNLHAISQKYGVKASKLIEYNFFNQDSKLSEGQKIYLRKRADLY
ncbi:MAG: glucosaminidase domain-containing protein [Marinifilaceae bacterium]